MLALLSWLMLSRYFFVYDWPVITSQLCVNDIYDWPMVTLTLCIDNINDWPMAMVTPVMTPDALVDKRQGLA